MKINDYLKGEGETCTDYHYLKPEYNLDGDFIIITAGVQYLSSLNKEKFIVMKGPKGAGKTCS